MDDWNDLIATIRSRSGATFEDRIPDEAVAFLDERFGVKLAETERAITAAVPCVTFEAGLSDNEVEAIESRFGFCFPPDLRAFLQTALPVGEQFPNWRTGSDKSLQEWLDRPEAGICFDVEHNAFWLPEWGPRPASGDEALRICRAQVWIAPRLIPIYSHRFIPAEPTAAGNPVISVHQTDIIHYGFDLEDYLRREFSLGGRKPWPEEVRRIRFWDVDRWQNLRWS
jgi:hypothetical protein